MRQDFAHYIRVANKFEYGTDEWLTGLLHDAIEDELCHASEIPVHIRGYVIELSRKMEMDESYGDYIARLCRSKEIVIRVKLADLEDNLARSDHEHRSLFKRYSNAHIDLCRALVSYER